MSFLLSTLFVNFFDFFSAARTRSKPRRHWAPSGCGIREMARRVRQMQRNLARYAV